MSATLLTPSPLPSQTQSAAAVFMSSVGRPIFTLQQILELIAQLTGRKFIYVPVPFFMLSIAGALFGWLPFAPITYDQVKLLRKDNVVKGGPDAGTVETLAELGISPTSAEAVVPSYLVVYRPTGQYFEREGV
jgi:hypothetical protein